MTDCNIQSCQWMVLENEQGQTMGGGGGGGCRLMSLP